MYAGETYDGGSAAEIGRQFGGKLTLPVLHSVEKIKRFPRTTRFEQVPDK